MSPIHIGDAVKEGFICYHLYFIHEVFVSQQTGEEIFCVRTLVIEEAEISETTSLVHVVIHWSTA
jgi:hypothetical protein